MTVRPLEYFVVVVGGVKTPCRGDGSPLPPRVVLDDGESGGVRSHKDHQPGKGPLCGAQGVRGHGDRALHNPGKPLYRRSAHSSRKRRGEGFPGSGRGSCLWYAIMGMIAVCLVNEKLSTVFTSSRPRRLPVLLYGRPLRFVSINVPSIGTLN